MITLLRLLTVCLSVFVCLAPAHAQTVRTPLRELPQIERPEAGSVAGSLVSFSLGAGELSRGTASIPLALALPEERGACPVPLVPSYTPEAPVSEWGQGFALELAIRRMREVGHLDYVSDLWTSPWGKLVPGDDGALYPLGFREKVRVRATAAGFAAIDARGTRFVFAHAERTARGLYAAWLSEVRGVAGEHASLRYVTDASGRPYLDSVRYGGAGAHEAQQVTFHYEALPRPLTSFVSGERRTLDRRVSEVRIASRAQAGADYVERYRYTLAHEYGFGPAPRLTTLTRHWPDQTSEPPVRYDYAEAFAHLSSAPLTRVPGVDHVLAAFGTAVLDPARATWFDVDDDGVLDLEHGAEQTLARNTASGFVLEPQAAETPADEARRICRPAPSPRNPPRRLAWFTRRTGQPQVVVTLPLGTRTRVVICDRDGSEVQHDGPVDGSWLFSEAAYVIDVDGDQRADLVRVRGHVVSTLLARGEPLRFEPGPTSTLAPRLTVSELTFRDFNGDGIADLIGRTRTFLAVWFGTGQGRFAPDVTSVALYSGATRLDDLTGFDFSYGDLDGDGLSDLVALRDRAVFVFGNDGAALRKLSVPALDARALDLRLPLFADVRYGGESELTFVRGSELWSLPLRAANTGLLTEVDDGRGAHIELHYGRGPTGPLVGGPARVLDALTRTAPARGTWTTRFDYDEPSIHPEAHYLLGYGRVRREEAWGIEEARFQHDADAPGVLLEQVESSTDHPSVVRFERHDYERVRLFDVPFARRSHTARGFRSLDVAPVQETRDFTRYEGLCATAWRDESAAGSLAHSVVLSQPRELADALHCLPESERWSARHADATRDVDMERTILRDPRGLPREVSWRDGTRTLVSERYDYDALGRLETARTAQGERATVHYDPASGRVISLEDAAGVVTKVADFDARTLAITALETRRDTATFREGFGYDGWERLARRWDSLAGTTEDGPSIRHHYVLGDAVRLGRIETEHKVHASALLHTAQVMDAAGESVTRATRIPEGWALGQVSLRDPGLRASDLSRIPHAVSALDGLPTMDGIALATTRSDAFGQRVDSEQRLQERATQQKHLSLTLDAQGLTATERENDRFVTRESLDASLRVLGVRDETNALTAFSYDALGRLVGVTLPDGTHHARRFDALGRARLITRDGVGSIQYDYDPQTGRLHVRTVRDADGAELRRETLDYDAQGRLRVVVAESDAGTERVERDYDGDGQSGQTGFVTAERTEGFVRTSRYFPDGKLHERREALAGFRTLTSRYAYTADGRALDVERVVEDADGRVLSRHVQHHGYDAYGRLTTLDVDGARVVTLAYDAENRLDHATLAGQRAAIPFYDPVVGALHGMSLDQGSWVSETRIELNDRGQVERELYATPAGDAWLRYEYDARGQLELAEGPGRRERYRYDRAGRPTWAEDRTGARDLATGDVQVVPAALAYDRAGRLIARGETSFVYGPRGRVIEASRADDHAQYRYDADGLRVLAAFDDHSVAYLSGGVLSDAGFAEPLTVGGRVVGILRGATLTLLGSDLRGTPFTALDGALSDASPFGVRSQPGARSPVLDFAGLGYDPVAGVVPMGVRDYDPTLGAFLTPDPALLEDPTLCLARPLECNLYGYAQGNPVSYVDGSGLAAEGAVPGTKPATKYRYIRVADVVRGENYQSGAAGAALGTILYNWLFADTKPNAEDLEALAGGTSGLRLRSAPTSLPGLGIQGPSAAPRSSSKPGYIPRDAQGKPLPLPQQTVNGVDIPLPAPEAGGAAHTVLGGRTSAKTGETYRQSATFPEATWPKANGQDVPWSRVDWSDHGRADQHTDPHQHVFQFDPNNGAGWRKGPPTPFAP